MIEALLVGIEKAAQVEVRTVIAVPLLQLLELRVPGESSHGGTRRANRLRRRKETGAGGAKRAAPRGAQQPL